MNATASTARQVAPPGGHSANQARLVAELESIKNILRKYSETSRVPGEVGHSGHSAHEECVLAGEASPTLSHNVNRASSADSPSEDTFFALDALCGAFSLSSFERAILLVCAGIELDGEVASLCAAAQGDCARAYPTYSLALAALPDAHWTALRPDGPLRRWRLIQIGNAPSLTGAPLQIDERILHYLTGVAQMDERLSGLIEPLPPTRERDLAPSQIAVAVSIASGWMMQRENHKLNVVQLCCAEPTDARGVAAAAAQALGLKTVVLASDLIPASIAELDALVRLWEREAVLENAVVFVEFDADFSGADGARAGAIRFVERVATPVMISTREPQRFRHRASMTFNISLPTAGEQRAAWRSALNGAVKTGGTEIDAIVSQFNLSFPAIFSSAAEGIARAATSGADAALMACESCRIRYRNRLNLLAQRIEPVADWEDLVLPEQQLQTLRHIAAQVRQRCKVYESWGFAGRSSRGLGITALFAGPSGTGKTMAAEVLARELQLDLYRVDLASVVSKYIGETEKALRRVFDAAEESGAILLFDEADAIFGKRSEVKDSHDRFANIQVSYLLQRMEAYHGLAILTSNLKGSLDSAFLRRLRFVVQFPFPEPHQRAEIWRRMFPASTPTENLDFGKLARLNVAGGNIRNIAMNAAFLAADAGEGVRMGHLLSAARAEYVKLERPLAEAEIGGWT